MDGLKIDKFHVLGWSLGGNIAMYIAATVPERVLTCAVMSSPCDIYHPSVTTKEKRKELVGPVVACQSITESCAYLFVGRVRRLLRHTDWSSRASRLTPRLCRRKLGTTHRDAAAPLLRPVLAPLQLISSS